MEDPKRLSQLFSGNLPAMFSIFWIGCFLNSFSNPFWVHSSPSFLFEPNFLFLLVVFCSHAAFWHWFTVFFFFKFFDLIIVGNGFPNSLLVRFRSNLLYSQWKIVELYVRTCPAMFVFISSSRFLLRPYDVTATFWLNFWSRVTYLTLKNNFLTLKWLFQI